MKWLSLACAACLLLVAWTTWSMLVQRNVEIPSLSAASRGAASRATDNPRPPRSPRATELLAARRSCDSSRLDRFIEDQRVLIAREPQDAISHQLCAEALLERVLLRNQLRGMTIGEPLYPELPPKTAADLDEALQRVTRARELGDDSADNHRLEAAILSNRITDAFSALRWNGRITTALEQAAKLDGENPGLHVTLGLRSLLAPTWLGHDPQKAFEHLAFAAEALPDDERPSLFAAMACYLQKKRLRAMELLERAVERNPNNAFARAVLERVRRDEPDPFGRDVSAAEALASKQN